MGYPVRPKFYAHLITRLLFKSCAAQSIGQDAVLLVIHIAHTEDAARYQGAVRFWNSQLNEVLGFRSPKSLNNARQKAIDAGWLHYERKHDRSDGKYWTLIPPNVAAFDDEPIEPSTPIRVPSTEQKREQEGYGKRNRKVTGNDLLPNPAPVPEREATPAHSRIPTIDEVREHFQSAGLNGSADKFFHHHESTGWMASKHKPIQRWRSAAANWSIRELEFQQASGKSTSVADRPEYRKTQRPPVRKRA